VSEHRSARGPYTLEVNTSGSAPLYRVRWGDGTLLAERGGRPAVFGSEGAAHAAAGHPDLDPLAWRPA
jgi:hypothetical protein